MALNGVTGKIFPDRVFEATNITVSAGTNVLTAVYRGPAFTNTQMVATNTSSVVVINPTFGYDAKGNLTNDAEFVYQYDIANRLTNVISKASGSSVLAARYDGLGRRVEVTRNGTTVERYVYFPGSFLVLAVLNGSNQIKEIYTHGPDLSGVVGGAGGIGGILSVSTNIGAASASKYFHADAMGNVILVSDSEAKQVASYGFTPFGKLVNQVGEYQARFLFSSKELDPETGLILYGVRYLNPDAGTWLTRDLLREMGGVNLYQAFRNSPVSFVDALGLEPSPEGCRVVYFYEREDTHGDAQRFLTGMRKRILLAYPCAELRIVMGNPIDGRRIRDARTSSDLIAVVGHGIRYPKRIGRNLVDPTDYTTQLQAVTNPDSPGGPSPTLEQIFPEKVRPKESTLDCVILGTCNNGYAPEKLPDGIPVVRLLPNVHDKPLGKRNLPRPLWDIPDSGSLSGPPEPGATSTIGHWSASETAILDFLRVNCCCPQTEDSK